MWKEDLFLFRCRRSHHPYEKSKKESEFQIIDSSTNIKSEGDDKCVLRAAYLQTD